MKNNLFCSSLSDAERLNSIDAFLNNKLDLVLDTDAATEVDDQFAIAHLLLSSDEINLRAIYAAPFSMNERTHDPAIGMEMSFNEIHKIRDLCDVRYSSIFKGSGRYLTDFGQPVDSEAASHLIDLAQGYTSQKPLCVACIGAITNLASAILIQPEIVNRIVVVWLGGDDFYYTPNVYNVYQDIQAAQVVFNSGVPLIHVPCNYVASHMITSVPELNDCIGNRNRLGDYLVQIVKDYGSIHFAWGKHIWDLAVSGLLIDRSFVKINLVNSPILTNELTYSFDGRRHMMANVVSIDRDRIFRDLFLKIRRISYKSSEM